MPETVDQTMPKVTDGDISESIRTIQTLLEVTGKIQKEGKLLLDLLSDEVQIPVWFQPPEVAVMDPARIGKQSDYYFITAVFYYCLTGKKLSRYERFCLGVPDLSDVIARNHMDERTAKLLCGIFRKGLAHGLKNRYQSLQQLQEDFDDLEKCIREKKQIKNTNDAEALFYGERKNSEDDKAVKACIFGGNI